MLTVTLGLEESGKRRTWRPLGRAYSVMPSTAVTFRTPWGRVWESAVNVRIRRRGSKHLLRVMSHLYRTVGRFRRIITGDVWGDWRLRRRPGVAPLPAARYEGVVPKTQSGIWRSLRTACGRLRLQSPRRDRPGPGFALAGQAGGRRII